MTKRPSDYDPTNLREHEERRTEEADRQRFVAKREEDDFKWLMSSKQGRSIVWRLMEEAGVFRISFNLNSMQMAFNEGKRDYGNRIFNLILTHTPELYPAMMKEATNGRNDRNADNTN